MPCHVTSPVSGRKRWMTGAAIAVANRKAPLDHTGHSPVTPLTAAGDAGQKWTPSAARTTLTGVPVASVPPVQGSLGKQGRVLVQCPRSSTAAPASTNWLRSDTANQL